LGTQPSRQRSSTGSDNEDGALVHMAIDSASCREHREAIEHRGFHVLLVADSHSCGNQS